MAGIKITNENKRRLVVEMLGNPPVVCREIAEELGYHPKSIARWMMEPTDEQTEKMLGAIARIKERKSRG